jgi:hypothetical protein
MSKKAKALDALVTEIQSADPTERPTYEERLSSLIDDLEAQGETVPSFVKCLREELVNENIEARFDNMPV